MMTTTQTTMSPTASQGYLSPRRRVFVNALILGAGALAALILSLGATAFAKETKTLSFTGAQQELPALVGDTVRVTAWLTYQPKDLDTAVLRGQKKTPFLKSLFGAKSDDGKALSVRVHKLPVETRVWMAESCADGCRVNVKGSVVRNGAGHVTMDVVDVAPAAQPSVSN